MDENTLGVIGVAKDHIKDAMAYMDSGAYERASCVANLASAQLLIALVTQVYELGEQLTDAAARIESAVMATG